MTGRAPSTRFATFVAGPDVRPELVLPPLRGDEPVIWVHETAMAAWGLPERLDDEHAARCSALFGVECRAVGGSGWLVAGEGASKAHMAFPGYSGDFAGAATPEALCDAVEAFRRAVGIAYAFSGPSTVHKLIGSLAKIGPAEPEPALEPPYVATAWSVPGNAWGLADLAPLEAAGRRWVKAYDRAGSYLSAWGSTILPVGEWCHVGPGWESPGPESSRVPGYYRVLAVDLPDPEGSFDPFRRHGGPLESVWLTAPLLQLAVELAPAPVRYQEAWLTPERCRALDGAYDRLRDARAQLEGLALDVLKTAYAGATAWLEYGPAAPAPLARPAWRRTVLDRYVANTWRGLAKATPGPFAVTEIDTALFALADPSESPEGLRLGDGIGAWKPKGQAIPMALAVAACESGGIHAVVRLCEQGEADG